jgi:NADPH:quinone reductase-like Zn-dependent oxidoreductase
MEATIALSSPVTAPVRALVQSGDGSTDVFSVGTVPARRPGRGEVVVAVKAAGLDRGTWHLMTGRPYLMRLMGFGFWAPKQPVAGLDLSGTVVELGEGVTRFRVGDEVFGIGQGSFTELTVAREDKLAKKPSALTFEEAAVLGVSGLTAIQALTDAGQLQRGERVLVIGASGGVGTYLVQIAKILGAHVTAVCSGSKMELVRSLGADVVLDYRAADFTATGERYDLVLDVGGGRPVSHLRRVMTETARLVFVGNEHGGDWTAGFGRQLWAMLLSPFVKQRFVMFMANEHFEGLERLAALADEGGLRPAIDRKIPLEGVASAVQDLEAGKVRGKIVVLPV